MEEKKYKVFLLPYAGSSVMTYSPWKNYIPGNIELVFLEMQGRGIKSEQTMSADFEFVVNQLYKEITSEITDEKYVIFGHSMGSLLAYELYYKIASEGFKMPEEIILSGRLSPELCIHMKKVSEYPENDFLKEVAVYGGLPEEIKINKELRDYFVPIMRADFKLIENYTYTNRHEMINCNLTIFYGNNDYSTPSDEIVEWRKKAGKKFSCIEFPGGHFFCMDKDNIKDIATHLEKTFR